MKQLKKTLLTLVALLAVTTQAWAQSPTIYFQQDYSTETVDWSTGTGGRYTPIIENGYLTVTQNQRQNNGTTLTCTATQGKVDAGKDFTMTFNVKLGASNNRADTEFNIYDAANSAPILSLAEGSVGATAWKINGGTQTATVSAGGGKSLNELSWIFVQVTSIAGGKTYLTLKDDQNNIIDGFDKTEIPTISVAGGLGKMTFETSRYLANFAIDNVLVCDVVNDAAASGPEVTWDKAEKTGTFTMPGGNVTLEPEYYPQAALTEAPTAINDVPATTDGAIVKAGTVANIGETTTAQGTVMYYVSQTALDDAALLALAADAWTADVPTAESLAQGQAYVYYYVRGNDSDTDEENFSDGDILAANALTVTIAAEPTYAVTFAKDNPEPDKWSADPNTGVKKGQTVTVTYTGTRKVIGVKAEKKAKAPTLAETLTTADMTVSVSFLLDGNAETVNFTSNGDGTYTKTGGTGTIATATDWTVQLVENSGLIVFKAYPSVHSENDPTAFKFNFFPSDNTYYMWAGKSAKNLEPTFTSISVNDTAIAVTEAQDS